MLDLGCAFGYGTGKLAARHRVVGMDLAFDYVLRAKRDHPEIPFVVASAQALPFASSAFGAVVCLDVIEHVPDDTEAVTEMMRVCADGAAVVLSAPHRGALAVLDSLNVYQRVRRRMTFLPPPPEIGEGWHRHYSASDLMQLSKGRLRLERSWVTGLGGAELVHLPLLFIVRGWLGWRRAFEFLQYLYFSIYLFEDLFPVPRWGYHLMILARLKA